MRASERTLPPLTSQLASIWLIFVLLGLGLQVLIQYSVLRNGELDWAAWASSIANDFLLMLPFLLVLGLPVLWLGAWSRLAQTPGLLRLLGVLQVLLARSILLAYGAEWATFYTTQRFLSQGFRFWGSVPIPGRARTTAGRYAFGPSEGSNVHQAPGRG